MSKETVVRIEDLWIGFRRRDGLHYVFRGANFEIRKGELVCLIGPSGSGKSVLLNLLIGTLRPGQDGMKLKGTLEVMDEIIEDRYPSSLSRRIGIVFQESALFEDLTSLENVAFGLRMQRLSGKEAAERVKSILASVDLSDPPTRTGELSGGQKKRLALARTLAKDPEFLIFDEPTTGLDPQLCLQIADLIRRTHEAGKGQRTTLVVTHDYQAMVPVATRVLLLNPGQGTIEEIKEGDDPGKRLLELPRTPPVLIREPGPGYLYYLLKKAVDAPLAWLKPLTRFLEGPLRGSLRQTLLRFEDSLIHPALYVCGAGAVLGGLATFFALQNNPLKGAMDRQALIGLGKVIVAILVPLMTAILFAARVGAGSSARLGNIRLGRQDDALRMLGSDPAVYLITPLFWSCLIGLPLLALPVAVSSSMGSLFCACVTRPITPFGWASAFFMELTTPDLYYGLIKLAGSGGLVAWVSVYLGLKRKTGAEDLGRDVTGTIVVSSFFVIVWHGVWTFIQYG
jgi:ABC-type multidrug transport system ATPase subunit/ABC-type transporter Mla maintaining outer membrane lipid asymmetry permease subunit MlaE